MVLDDITMQFRTLPYPSTSCTGKTIIITGANIGLGLEAARHFARLSASKIILAVRSLSKGSAAKHDIEKTTSCAPSVIEVWELDLSSYASVKAFAAKMGSLDRIDVLIANAGVATAQYERSEGNENTITVNVVSTALLVLLALPIVRLSARKSNTTPVVSVVTSNIHGWATFKERDAESVFAALNDEKSANMGDRYPVSKLLQIFVVQEIAERMTSMCDPVVLNMLTPGLAKTGLARSATGLTKYGMIFMSAVMARTAEEGSRTLVHAALLGPESHGHYVNNCEVDPKGGLSKFVRSVEGAKAREKVWGELVTKLDTIQPGIMKVLE